MYIHLHEFASSIYTVMHFAVTKSEATQAYEAESSAQPGESETAEHARGLFEDHIPPTQQQDSAEVSSSDTLRPNVTAQLSSESSPDAASGQQVQQETGISAPDSADASPQHVAVEADHAGEPNSVLDDDSPLLPSDSVEFEAKLEPSKASDSQPPAGDTQEGDEQSMDVDSELAVPQSEPDADSADESGPTAQTLDSDSPAYGGNEQALQNEVQTADFGNSEASAQHAVSAAVSHAASGSPPEAAPAASDDSALSPAVQPESHQTGSSKLSRVLGAVSVLLHRSQPSDSAVQHSTGEDDLQSQSENPHADLSPDAELGTDAELHDSTMQQQQHWQTQSAELSDSLHLLHSDPSASAPHADSDLSFQPESIKHAQPQLESEQEPSGFSQADAHINQLSRLAPPSLYTAAAAASIAAAVAVLTWLLRRSSATAAAYEANPGHDLAEALQQMSLSPEADAAVAAGTPLASASVEPEEGSNAGVGSQLGSSVQTGGRARKPRGKRELTALGESLGYTPCHTASLVLLSLHSHSTMARASDLHARRHIELLMLGLSLGHSQAQYCQCNFLPSVTRHVYCVRCCCV